MGHIFRHKENKKLYTIEHFLIDLHFMDRGGRTGIYATPYKWNGKIIKYTKDQSTKDSEGFNPIKFVEDNFDIVGEIW